MNHNELNEKKARSEFNYKVFFLVSLKLLERTRAAHQGAFNDERRTQITTSNFFPFVLLCSAKQCRFYKQFFASFLFLLSSLLIELYSSSPFAVFSSYTISIFFSITMRVLISKRMSERARSSYRKSLKLFFTRRSVMRARRKSFPLVVDDVVAESQGEIGDVEFKALITLLLLFTCSSSRKQEAPFWQIKIFSTAVNIMPLGTPSASHLVKG